MTRNRIEKYDRAVTDIEEISDHIAEDNLEAAIRFIEELERTLSQLADIPHIGYHRFFSDSEFDQIRVFPVSRRFKNYLIIYEPTEEGIDVLRVMHGAQDIEQRISKD
jgi:toxin ParE1/3/4